MHRLIRDTIISSKTPVIFGMEIGQERFSQTGLGLDSLCFDFWKE